MIRNPHHWTGQGPATCTSLPDQVRDRVGRFPILSATAFTLLALLTVACGDDGDTGTNPTGDGPSFEVPLAIGNRWEFTLTDPAPTPDPLMSPWLTPAQASAAASASAPFTAARASAAATSTAAASTAPGSSVPATAAVPVESSAQPPAFSGDSYTIEVAETTARDGESYWVLRESGVDKPEDVHLRQDGPRLWLVVPNFFGDPSGDVVGEWLVQQAEDSFPWKLGDLEARVGEPWINLQASETIQTKEVAYDLFIKCEGLNLGTVETVTPAGTFSATRSRITVNVSVSAGGAIFGAVITQETDIVNGVGLVRIYEESQAGTQVESETSLLVDFELSDAVSPGNAN